MYLSTPCFRADIMILAPKNTTWTVMVVWECRHCAPGVLYLHSKCQNTNIFRNDRHFDLNYTPVQVCNCILHGCNDKVRPKSNTKTYICFAAFKYSQFYMMIMVHTSHSAWKHLGWLMCNWLCSHRSGCTQKNVVLVVSTWSCSRVSWWHLMVLYKAEVMWKCNRFLVSTALKQLSKIRC